MDSVSLLLPPPRIVCIGDSLSQYGWSVAEGGFAGLLAEAYSPRADVIGRGMSGFTSRMLLHYLQNGPIGEVLDCSRGRTRILYVTLCIGANDASIGPVNPAQYVPIEEYRENLRGIVGAITRFGIPNNRIIVIPPPPIDPNGTPFLTKAGKTTELTEQYARACLEEAEALGTRVTDIRLFRTAEDIWVDGLHLNKMGNFLMYRSIMSACGAELCPEMVPYPWPHWTDYPEKAMGQ
ncbi:Isoamyl-acetate hydrolyzing esterase-like protein [Giardia muris]|uniref:Isoamyl-acetate hydrolyzing esterase-like protein n=1 Tax=Giardia muris TaxID=5742 RepID=A0A4Z1SS86_GIAMU|nr:Isoamyl-acetate hydrolyzing esterase-like protein [Giardia muris]|eukprot:TNJ27855.1 Isoamyl-acetate hydrolyzing esterase-like protein [Giardia muris]